MFRAELDALPIQEKSDKEWASTVPGKGHLCGHDGHMMFLLALGRLVSRTPVACGKVVLMFQPAEEDGSGARAVVTDPQFAELKPDYAFAIHIEPGKPWGYVATRPGLINCASVGLCIELTGKTSHAASVNDDEATKIAINAMQKLNITYGDQGLPMRASEDFGVFGWDAKAAMLCMGPGENYAALHNPDYDFPDDLLPMGAALFERITRDLLGGN